MPPPGQGRSADLHHDEPPPHLGRGRWAILGGPGPRPPGRAPAAARLDGL